MTAAARHFVAAGAVAVLVLAGGLARDAAPRAAELHAVVHDQHGGVVADAVVTAMPMDPKNLVHTSSAPDVVDQIDQQFFPYVKAVYVGAQVIFPNKDNVQHQVYSFSPAKKFELPLYAGLQAPPITFDRTGIVVLGCNIHDWMVGYIYVSATPFFAVSAADGTALLQDLPAGAYQASVWHPNMNEPENATMKPLALSSAEVQSLDLTVRIKSRFRLPGF